MTRKQNWRITGPVTYREGDGIHMAIPLGPCDVKVTAFDATISWVDGTMRGAAAVSLGLYARWRTAGWISAE